MVAGRRRVVRAVQCVSGCAVRVDMSAGVTGVRRIVGVCGRVVGVPAGV
jgi:hypothetical protein